VSNAPRPMGPMDDPRLVDRQGDLSGFSALVFAGLVLLAFALMAMVLFLVMPAGGLPTPSPTPTPTPTPRPTASTAATAVASARPGPLASAGLMRVAPGSPAPIVSEGRQLGTVTTNEVRYTRRLGADEAPNASRFLVALVKYEASAPLHYDAASWVAIDVDGAEHPWRGSGDPAPALGSGTLNAGETRTGTVSFEVPRRRPVRALVLRDDTDADLVRVDLP
jgi:hypothetical protein